MKTQKIKTISIFTLALLIFAASNLYAQRGNGYGQGRAFDRNQACNMIPDLSEEQETQINSLRVTHLKEMNSFKNEMNELRAKKQTLMEQDDANLKEINSVIDQMTDIHNKLMKASAKHQQDIRSLLTEEQKVFFDSRPKRRQHRKDGRRDGRRAYYLNEG